jgi:hypothetical protein
VSRAERTFITHCSLVVTPVDIWTGATPNGSSIRISLAETDRKPIRTSDGSYAFLDYSGHTCTLVITSSTYLEYRSEIQFIEGRELPLIRLVSLLPNTVYSPPAAGTGFIFKVCDESGLPIAGAQASAYIIDEGAVKGRLAEERTAGDGNCIRISPGNGRLLPGDSFVLRERDGSATDWGRVTDLQGDPSVLMLEGSLSQSWNRGSRLMPAVKTISDQNGMVVIPFRGFLPSPCSVCISIVADNRSYSAIWQAESGRVTHLPAVQLQPS